MFKKTIWIIIIIVVVILLGSILNSQKSVEKSSVKIGVINPMSGPAGNIGEEVTNSLRLASTTNVSFVFEDDQCDTKKAISSYLKLKEEGVHIFYVSCSGSVIALAPLAKEDGNLIVTAYAGSSEIRKTGDEVIRFIPDAISIAEAMAKYASTTLPSTAKLGLLYEDQDYAKSAALILKEKLGSRIIAEEKYTAFDDTFRTQITKFKGLGINALLYVPTSDKAAQLVYKEMQTLKFSPQIIGDVNTCEYPFSPRDFGLKAVCFDAGFSTETPDYKAFVTSYKAVYGKDGNATFYNAITYDIAYIIDSFAQSYNGKDFVVDLKKYILQGVSGKMAQYNFTPEGEVLDGGNYLKMFEK